MKTDYRSNTTLGQEYHGNQTDYRAVKDRARELKHDLQTSKIIFGSAKRLLSTDYRDGYQWDSDKSKNAKQALIPPPASQYTPGDPTVKPDYVTEKEFSNKKLMEDAKSENRDRSKEALMQQKLKMKLSKNTFQIGNDQRYMY